MEPAHQREFGYAEVRAHGHTKLLEGIEDFVTPEGHGMLKVWMSHGDKVTKLPPGFQLMASTGNCPIAGIADESRRYYGVQFHPEVTHTVQGKALLERFVLGIAGAKADWIMTDHVEKAVQRIREQVGDEEVILGLSGGVDSSVAAALIHRAIGDQLTCVFVDHGLLRLDEGKMVMEMFEGRLHAKVVHVDASAQFLGHLAGVTDPEQKRKIIGREFVEVFKAEAARLKAGDGGHKGAQWLAQGTIYPDVVESGGAKTKKAITIKSHHNVGGLPEQLGLKLLEPLRDLFKDEVRELGVALGLPPEMVYRHPFPGPGLGVRILGEVKKEYADLLRRADAIFIEELRNWKDGATGKNWYELTSQAFTVFLPVKSVGVMGDGRTYDYVVALRAVQTSDFMTADWAELPLRPAQEGVGPHHQRGARHQPRHLRRELEAACHDRVGVSQDPITPHSEQQAGAQFPQAEQWLKHQRATTSHNGRQRLDGGRDDGKESFPEMLAHRIPSDPLTVRPGGMRDRCSPTPSSRR